MAVPGRFADGGFPPAATPDLGHQCPEGKTLCLAPATLAWGCPGMMGFRGPPSAATQPDSLACLQGRVPQTPLAIPGLPRGKALPIPPPLQGSHTAGDRAESRKVMPRVCMVPYDDFIDTFDCVRSTPANRRPVTARTKIRAAQVSRGYASLGVPGSNPAWTEDRQLPGSEGWGDGEAQDTARAASATFHLVLLNPDSPGTERTPESWAPRFLRLAV